MNSCVFLKIPQKSRLIQHVFFKAAFGWFSSWVGWSLKTPAFFQVDFHPSWKTAAVNCLWILLQLGQGIFCLCLQVFYLTTSQRLKGALPIPSHKWLGISFLMGNRPLIFQFVSHHSWPKNMFFFVSLSGKFEGQCNRPIGCHGYFLREIAATISWWGWHWWGRVPSQKDTLVVERCGKQPQGLPKLDKCNDMCQVLNFFWGVEMLENDVSFPHEELWLNEWQVDWSSNWTTKKQPSTTKTPPSHRNTSCTFFLASLILASPASPPIEARFQQIWMNTSVTAWWPSKIILSGLQQKYTWQFFVTQPFWETVHLRVWATSVEERDSSALNSCFFCLLFLYRMLILYLTFSHEIFFCWTSLISIFLAVLFKPFSHPPRFGQTNHAYDHRIFGVHLKRPWDTGNSQEICCMGRLWHTLAQRSDWLGAGLRLDMMKDMGRGWTQTKDSNIEAE